ncbi:hypothetical protein [Yersinia kristensenii]|uniref:hypothetical protein n=1 Tax=Yersinia kristensenii TaxID=28152 RepID=UPI0011A5B3BD|nr:hypothetical protein [Yersinia kristensenii]
MNLVLFSNSGKWSWSLHSNTFVLAKSAPHDDFVTARRHAEAFRMGASNPVIIDSATLGELHEYTKEKKLIFSISKINDGCELRIVYPTGILLVRDVIHPSKIEAEQFAHSFAEDILNFTDIVSEDGSLLHPLHHSRAYREMFDIEDDHPSAK